MLPSVRSLVSRALAPLTRAAEGQVRQGPFHLPLSGGWLPDGTATNFWQLGQDPISHGSSAIVERCVAAYSETISSLSPAAHWRRNDRGGRTRVENSALSRVLSSPNGYDSSASFMLNLVHNLFSEGNGFALALRSARFEVTELHLMNPRQSSPFVVRNDEDGSAEIFYRLGGNAVVEHMFGNKQLVVPARDVLHVRLHDSRRWPSPLMGETPLAAAMQDVALGNALAQQQVQFLLNQARPSAILSTDLVLSRDEVQQLRDRSNEQSKGLHAGGVPLLTAGLKVIPWHTTSRDAQLAELARISYEQICWAFRVPLQLLGIGGAPFSSTETLMQFWLASGLGFALNLVEQSFDRLFGLKGEPAEFTEFDTAALLRTAQKDRIEALARAVQAGIYSSNEARALEGLDATPFGDEPRVQAQNVPLSAAGSIPAAPLPPSAPAAAANYQDALQRDLAALTARAKRAERIAALDGAAEPRKLVIRKMRANESDADLRAKFRAASANAKEWPGLRSEYDKLSGKVEFLGAPIKLQAQEGTTPAARGEKTMVAHPERLYATQFWLHRNDGGHGAMLPDHERRFGKGAVVAETLDGRLHLLDGHHLVFHHLRAGKRALSAFVFPIPTAIFEDGSNGR